MVTLSDEFLLRVAAAHAIAVADGKHPGIAISRSGVDGTGSVPVRTAHRWIYTARKRGFLPAHGQGRAGPESLPKRWEHAREQLSASIECVLLDHANELDGDNVDANLAELAFAYEQVTGWRPSDELDESFEDERDAVL